jgi:hypothetical protein
LSSDDPIGRDVRKLRRVRTLGDQPVCVLCGEQNPTALTRVGRSLLEDHHLAGRVNDDTLVAIVCRNCHAVLSEAQRDSGVDLRQDAGRASLERLEAVLRGLADFFEQLVRSLRQWADEIARTVCLLDDDHPEWRSLK